MHVCRGTSYAEAMKRRLETGARDNFIQWRREDEYASELAISPEQNEGIRQKWAALPTVRVGNAYVRVHRSSQDVKPIAIVPL